MVDAKKRHPKVTLAQVSQTATNSQRLYSSPLQPLCSTASHHVALPQRALRFFHRLCHCACHCRVCVRTMRGSDRPFSLGRPLSSSVPPLRTSTTAMAWGRQDRTLKGRRDRKRTKRTGAGNGKRRGKKKAKKRKPRGGVRSKQRSRHAD